MFTLKVGTGIHLPDTFPVQSILQKGRCFIAIGFQLCFGICHEEGSGRLGGTETERETSDYGLHRWC